MKLKQLGTALLACMVIFNFSAFSVNAASIPSDSTIVMRAGGQINHSINANTITTVGSGAYLEKGDNVTFKCSYTPKSASVDFGYIGSDNVFHYLNCTNGNVDLTVSVAKSGQYTIAIRNNENYAVTVSGTIKY